MVHLFINRVHLFNIDPKGKMVRRGGIGVNKNEKREEWDMERRKRGSFVQMKKAGIFCFEDFGFFLLRKFKNESRQFIPSGGIELVPFFPCEGDFCPFDDAWNTGSVSCTYNHLYVGRMAQKPCYGYAVFCGVVFFR